MRVFGALLQCENEQDRGSFPWLSLPAAMLLLLLLSWSSTSEANILLLSSHHQGLPWRDELIQTFREELGRTGISEIEIEYMNTQSVNTDLPATQALRNKYSNKFANRPIDVVLTTDDNAFIFAQRFRDEIFHSAPIVFAGVDNPGLYDQIDSFKTVGVVEVNPYFSTIGLIRALHPDTKRILAVFDQSAAGEAAWRELSTLFSRYPNIAFERISGADETLEEIEDRLRELPDEAQILFHSLSRDASKHHISPSTAVNRISQASPRPVYAMDEQAIQNGALGGFAISPRDQAIRASSMAISVLFGKPVDEIQLASEPTAVAVFDAQQLSRFGISRNQLPGKSLLLNDTQAFRNGYGQWVLLAGLIIAGFLSANLALQRNSRNRKNKPEAFLVSSAEQGIVANYDRSTRLKNSYHFQNWLASLSGDEEFAVSVFDIDHFKKINELYSHKAGERIVSEVAKRLEETFDQETNLFRLGDDEFGVVSFIEELDLNPFIAKLKSLFATPFPISSTTDTKISVSGGVVHSKKLRDLAMLPKCLEVALIEAKRTGRNQILEYRREYTAKNNQLMEASVRVRRLVNQGKRFDFLAQPLVSLKTRQTVGYELLLRLTFEGGAPMPPLLAVEACETVGLLRQLNLETFQSAAHLLSLVDSSRYVTINLSRSQLMISDLLKDLIKTMNSKNQDLNRIVVEVTEEQYLEDAALIAVLDDLKKAGVRLALDDVGRGHSSLTALKQLPLDVAKLDKHFLDHKSERYTLDSLTHVRQLCSSLGLQVLAEGIEDSDDLNTCIEAGFDLGQGYLISCPLSFDGAAHFPRYPQCIAKRASGSDRPVRCKCPPRKASASAEAHAASVYPLRVKNSHFSPPGPALTNHNTATSGRLFDQPGRLSAV